MVTTKWWSVGVMDEHGWRNGGYFTHSAAQKDVQKTVVVPQIKYIAVCDATTTSPKLQVCSETVEVLRNAVNRQGGRCPCCDAFAFSHNSKQAKKSLSPSESSVKNQIACSIWNVLCGLRHGRKLQTMSVVQISSLDSHFLWFFKNRTNFYTPSIVSPKIHFSFMHFFLNILYKKKRYFLLLIDLLFLIFHW